MNAASAIAVPAYRAAAAMGSVDPAEEQDGYDDFLVSKRKEWAKLLKAARIDPEGMVVLTIAADPFQRVGNDPSPSPSD